MSNTYRDRGEDDDDDDLDDLDDVLASFDKPIGVNAGPSKRKAPSASPARIVTPLTPAPQVAATSAPAAAEEGENDEDFEASLVEGMESLLRQLAGDHPPGPMPDTPSSKSQQPASKGKAVAMTDEEEEAAWEKAVQELLSGDGLEALGIPQQGGKGKAKDAGPVGEKPSFDETIRRTMESLNSAKKPAGQGEDGKDLAALLKALQSDPNAMDGLEGLGDDDDLGGLLDGMMSQLMTREVLEEPMAELATKYPAYLESPPAGVSPADLEQYRNQKALVDQILAVFRKADYDDEKDGKEIARLVGEMQDLGGPPQEIMGEMPEGFDLSALGEEGCAIM